MNVIKICVVSGHPIIVAGIRTLLTELSGSDRFVCVPDPGDAHVVIYDAFNLALPDYDPGELKQLIAEHPGRVLALSRLLQPALTARALAAGAVAPVSIGADTDELVALIEAVATGEVTRDAELAHESLERLITHLRTDVGLTAREQTVLALIAAGYSNHQIATKLYITINTVKTTIRSTYSKLGVTTRAQAVAWAIEHGYASLPPRPRAG
jgi:NarL family two-component system response regulator LiaR